MRAWLDRVLPAGPLHSSLTTAAEFGLKVLLILVLFVAARWLALRGIQTLMIPFLARAQREGETSVTRLRTLAGLAKSAVTYTLLFLALVTLLSEFGVNISALLAGAGVAGLALSFGSQRLIRDVLTGFFMLLEDQLRVGEVVTLVGGPGLPQLTGTVLEMGLRVTRLRDIAGKIVTIGNGDIAAVINHHRGPISATVELGVPSETPLSRLDELIRAVRLPEDLFTGPAEVEGVTALDAEKMTVRVAAPARPGMAPEGELALRRLAAEALRAAEVPIR